MKAGPGLGSGCAEVSRKDAKTQRELGARRVTTKYSKGTKTGRDWDLGVRRFLAKTLRRKGGMIAKGKWDDY
jgi:hypothetical protein